MGAKNDSIAAHQHVFHWSDGSNLTFTNWANGYPKVRTTDSCIQMSSDEEVRGKWSNEPCTRKNLVVCEKEQTWSLKKLQALVVQTMQNPVPLGFIYVQLPQEKSPQEIWPWMSWTDISPQFDSTFFRVAGSKAEVFGKTQPELIPFIDSVEYTDCQWKPTDACAKLKAEDRYLWGQNISQSGGWSGKVSSPNAFNIGNSPASTYKAAMRFHVTPGEVRPKNMAVKVWKRTG